MIPILRWKASALSLAPALTVIALTFVAWEVLVRVSGISAQVLPAPSRIWNAGWEDRVNLGSATSITALEALGGLAGAIVVGAIVASVLFMSAPVRRTVQPLLVISQTIPLIAMAPLLIIWFGFGFHAKLFLVCLYGMFPVAIATLQGLRQTPLALQEVARTWGRSRRWILWHICWPSALPQFFAGVRIAATYAFATAAMAEFVGARNGLGIYILSAQSSFRTDLVFVGAIVLAILTLILFAVMLVVESLVLKPGTSRLDEEAS